MSFNKLSKTNVRLDILQSQGKFVLDINVVPF